MNQLADYRRRQTERFAQQEALEEEKEQHFITEKTQQEQLEE